MTRSYSHKASPKDMDRLGLIASFVTVAEFGSFVTAADYIGQTPSTISRQVSKLEDRLGVRLFNRTTRHVSLTEAGRLYHAHCSQLLDSLAEADDMVAHLNAEPRGLLRVSVPVAFGHLHISKAVSDFLSAYENIQIEVNYTDRYVDLVEEGYDMAVRIGNLSDSSLVVRRIASNRRLLVASPGYLERHGVPSDPDELAKHRCLILSLYTSQGNVWRFRRTHASRTVAVRGVFRSDNSEAIHDAALADLGIGVVATYICHDTLRSGRLKLILPEWRIEPEAGIYVAYPSRRYLANKIKAFSDFLVERFRTPPWHR